MKARKLLGVIIALTLMICAFAAISTASAQMCYFTLYVNGSPYSSTASYAVSGQLKYNSSTKTVTLNSFNGQSIEAVANGFIDDDDAPAITINVVGDSYLTGGVLRDSAYYGAIYAEMREGGSGADSSVTITSSNGSKLTISKWDNPATRATQKNYAAIMADNVIISGDVNLDLTTKVYGLGDSSHKYTASGIYAASLVSFANDGINNINIAVATHTYSPGGGKIVEYKSNADVSGVYVSSNSSKFRSQHSKGYSFVNVSESNVESGSIVGIKAINHYIAYSSTALYIDGGVRGTTISGNITQVSGTKRFSINETDYKYDAFIPSKLSDNAALKNIDLAVVINNPTIYRIGANKPAADIAKTNSQAVIKTYVEKTTSLTSNTTVDFNEFEDGCYYRYMFKLAPRPGIFLSSETDTTSWTDSFITALKSKCNLRAKPDAVAYVYSMNIGCFIFRYYYKLPTITAQPAAVTTGTTGDVSFTVEATGNELTYSWYRITDHSNQPAGIAGFSGKNTKTLTLKASETSDGNLCEFNANEFNCTVSSAFGSVTTEKAKLTVNHEVMSDSAEKVDADNHKQTCYCGEEIVEAHSWILDSSKTVTATCAKEGSETYNCSVCGDTKTEKFAKLSHTFGAWAVTVNETCAKSGEKAAKCKNCDYTKTEVIPATGNHTYKNVVKKATTSADGKITPTCSVCNVTKKATTISKIASVKAEKTKYTYTGKSIKPGVTVKDSNGNTLKKDTDYTLSYKDNKNVGTATVTVTFKGNYKGTETLTFKILPKQVTDLKASTVKTTSIKLTWTKVTGAKYYKVEQSTDGKKWKTVTTTDKTSYTVKSLKAGTKYQFRVTALDSTKKLAGKASAVLKTGTLTSAPTVTLKSSKSKTAVASWKKVTGASKYIVYKSTDGKKWTKVTTTTKLTYTLTKLTANKKVYVKVVAVNAYGKNSADSKAVNVTVKK